MEIAAKGLNAALRIFHARDPSDLDRAFAAMANENVDALTVIEDAILIPGNKRIAELAVKQRLPSISFIEYAEVGGLFGYGPNILALYRRVAVFVDKILKGAKPADLPIERPTKFELVINLKTAKQIGLTIPPNVLVRADRVIK